MDSLANWIRALAGAVSAAAAVAAFLLAQEAVEDFRFSNRHERVVDQCVVAFPSVRAVQAAFHDYADKVQYMIGYEIKFEPETPYSKIDLFNAIRFNSLSSEKMDALDDKGKSEVVERFLRMDYFTDNSWAKERSESHLANKKLVAEFEGSYEAKIAEAELNAAKIYLLVPERGEKRFEAFFEAARDNHYFLKAIVDRTEQWIPSMRKKAASKFGVWEVHDFEIKRACEEAVENVGVLIGDEHR